MRDVTQLMEPSIDQTAQDENEAKEVTNEEYDEDETKKVASDEDVDEDEEKEVTSDEEEGEDETKKVTSDEEEGEDVAQQVTIRKDKLQLKDGFHFVQHEQSGFSSRAARGINKVTLRLTRAPLTTHRILH